MDERFVSEGETVGKEGTTSEVDIPSGGERGFMVVPLIAIRLPETVVK